MKAKRFLLHLCILALAVICIGAGAYVCYYELRIYNNDNESHYNYAYEKDTEDLLAYGYAVDKVRNKFGNPNKVLIKDVERGNVTVQDIWEIFQDKYIHYYYSGAYMEYADFDDYMESSEGNSGTLYKEDKNLMKTFKKIWKEEPTNKEKKEDYTYYKKKCEYVDEYAELINTLLYGMKFDGKQIDISDIESLIEGAYPSARYGLVYYVEYTSKNKQYVLSNVESEKYFEKEEVIDITVKDNEKLVQKDPLYGVKDIEELSISATSFLKKVNKLYIAVDTSVDSEFLYYIENAKEQPTNEEIEVIEKREAICIVTIIIALLLAVVLFIVLMFMAGHKEKGDEARLYTGDNLWLEIIVAIVAVAFVCEIAVFIDVLEGAYSPNIEKIAIVSLIVLMLISIEATVLTSESFMRRIKTKALIETTLLGRIFKLVMKLIKKVKALITRLWSNIHLTWKVVILGIAFVTFEMFNSYLSYEYGIEGVIVQIIVATILICGLVWLYFDENKKIKEGAKKIAEGNINYKIEEKMKFSVNEQLKNSVNSIGDGINSAVMESIKNERMKTELIANVSHDLKTPLTSIINYVDLLKNEGMDSENSAKYLDVLDKKSQRLKNLTEDLVEVSKLNSGAVNLQLEKIDIVQLVKQSLGEYAEKFAERKLQVIKSIQQEPIYVMADGGRTWRLFENLYQNVYKYAMPGTRVYIDIKQEYGKAVVSVKNISEGPLNFSADELMERFVRGDVSRTTEGSGLGLSIARSIAERQNGSMNIILDGDLFKVEVMMNLINQ